VLGTTIAKLARVAVGALAIGGGAAGAAATTSLNALAMPGKLVAQGGVSAAVAGVAQGVAAVAVAAPTGIWDSMVLPNRGVVSDLMRDVSPAGYMA